LDLNEFAAALQQVNGPARSVDVARIQRDVKKLRVEMKELIEMCYMYFGGEEGGEEEVDQPRRARTMKDDSDEEADENEDAAALRRFRLTGGS